MLGPSQRDDPERKCGVYCLANDGVLDWFIAFCESLRAHEPPSRLGLTVIPYDDSLTAVLRLQERYAFEILDDDSLGELDRIGERICPGEIGGARAFRKLASFWGPYD